MLHQRTASAMQLCGRDSRKICFTDTHTDELLSVCSLARGDHGSDAGDFSIFFATDGDEEAGDGYSIGVFPTAPAVDCTLSLGTPSTRYHTSRPTPAAAPGTSSSSTDIQHPQQRRIHLPSSQWDGAMTSCQRNGSPKPSSETAAARTAGSRADQTPGGSILKSPGDPLLARRCASCDTTSTPLWRNGPRGPKSLCNACGIRYKKEERRAAFSAVGSPSAISSSRPPMLFTLPAGTVLDQQQYRHDVYGHPCGCSLIRTAVACKWPPSAAPLSPVAQSRVDELIEVAATQPDPSSRRNVPTAHRWPVASCAPSLLQDYT